MPQDSKCITSASTYNFTYPHSFHAYNLHSSGGKKKTPDKALSHTVDSKGNLILH